MFSFLPILLKFFLHWHKIVILLDSISQSQIVLIYILATEA